MPPSKALLDTTVLADALLRQDDVGIAARRAIAAIGETLLPQFAIKEMRSGPLRGYIWLFNRVTTSSWDDALNAIPALFVQRNLHSTAMQAAIRFQSSLSSRLTDEIAEKYPGTTLDKAMKAEALIFLKTIISRAWRRRKTIASRITNRLQCYSEPEMKFDRNGTIDLGPLRCSVEDCCLRAEFTARPKDVKALFEACDQLPPKPETQKRRQALRHLNRTPNRTFDPKLCVALGDAVFAFQCPSDAVVLTTNIDDHGPLTKALGKLAIRPSDLA